MTILALERKGSGKGEALDTVRAHVWVSGDVQGVNFRADCRDEATARGIRGWVRNLPDGRVEAVFEGDRGVVDKMIEWCRGSRAPGNVEHVDVSFEPFRGAESGFRVIR